VVADFVAAQGLNGAGLVVVDRDDGIVHHQHWGVFSPGRISLVASSSKMISAGVLLHLADRGLLDLDAPVVDAVDWGPTNPTITPAQLLSNSSGLVGLLPEPAYGPYICQFLAAGTLQDCARGIFVSPADDLDQVAPDTEFRYGGGQWQVAGGLAEAVSGRTWAELIEEIFVEPCGLERLGYNNHFAQLASNFDYPVGFNGDPAILTPTDNPNIEGGAYLTTGDYGKLLAMLLRDGRCGDTQVLSAESLDRMFADRIDAVYDGVAFDGRGYGMGWWVDRGTDRVRDPGAYGATAWLDLAKGYGAFVVIESDAVDGTVLAESLYDPVAAAMG
jgi:CubicO group peptidase (beta-lactamase class C family)